MRILHKWIVVFICCALEGMVPIFSYQLFSGTYTPHEFLQTSSSLFQDQPFTILSNRQQEITQSLDKIRLNPDDPEIKNHWISYDDFKNINAEYTIIAKRQLELWGEWGTQSTYLLDSLGIDASHYIFSEDDQPDYGKETKGFPFIFLTDASGHHRQSIVQEVKHVMESVRQANPQARILLALEFARMADFATPIRFAGQSKRSDVHR
ncbi:MAG: hypothetical protein IJ876_05915 [Elusimicrobiaceae bacterium]|nr:hypothetical protein [Elusimicrobiaceae bacterium]